VTAKVVVLDSMLYRQHRCDKMCVDQNIGARLAKLGGGTGGGASQIDAKREVPFRLVIMD